MVADCSCTGFDVPRSKMGSRYGGELGLELIKASKVLDNVSGKSAGGFALFACRCRLAHRLEEDGVVVIYKRGKAKTKNSIF